jgi:hypothetical protein
MTSTLTNKLADVVAAKGMVPLSASAILCDSRRASSPVRISKSRRLWWPWPGSVSLSHCHLVSFSAALTVSAFRRARGDWARCCML